jgi:hypothetical protein
MGLIMKVYETKYVGINSINKVKTYAINHSEISKNVNNKYEKKTNFRNTSHSLTHMLLLIL